MAINPNNSKIFTITAAGGTSVIDCNYTNDLYIINGTATLTSGFTLGATNQQVGTTLNILYIATVSGSQNVTILGRTLTSTEVATNNLSIIATCYDGTNFTLNLSSDTAALINLPLNISNLTGMTDGQMIVANGTVPTAVPITGAISVSDSGVTTINSGVVTGANIANNTITTSNISTSSSLKSDILYIDVPLCITSDGFSVPMPTCTVTSIYAVLTIPTTLVVSGPATVTLTLTNLSILGTLGTITFPASSPVGSGTTLLPMGGANFTNGNLLQIGIVPGVDTGAIKLAIFITRT